MTQGVDPENRLEVMSGLERVWRTWKSQVYETSYVRPVGQGIRDAVSRAGRRIWTTGGRGSMSVWRPRRLEGVSEVQQLRAAETVSGSWPLSGVGVPQGWMPRQQVVMGGWSVPVLQNWIAILHMNWNVLPQGREPQAGWRSVPDERSRRDI
jgi:hypothetical protein